jgi:hypothetical protein
MKQHRLPPELHPTGGRVVRRRRHKSRLALVFAGLSAFIHKAPQDHVCCGVHMNTHQLVARMVKSKVTQVQSFFMVIFKSGLTDIFVKDE